MLSLDKMKDSDMNLTDNVEDLNSIKYKLKDFRGS